MKYIIALAALASLTTLIKGGTTPHHSYDDYVADEASDAADGVRYEFRRTVDDHEDRISDLEREQRYR